MKEHVKNESATQFRHLHTFTMQTDLLFAM
jgi:hypothetical protein